MIIKLLPQQIVDLWDSIRYGIISAIDPMVSATPENIQAILCQLLRGDMQCWCIFSEDKKIYGYITTSIGSDMNTGFKTLTIYSLFMYKKADINMTTSAFESIKNFAKANKCSRMVACSANPNAISMAEKFGFSKDYTFLVLEV